MADYSGRYWQLFGENGQIFTSPSLFDEELPRGMASADGPELWESDGPNGQVRGIRENVSLEDGTNWTVSVAASLAVLAAIVFVVGRDLLASGDLADYSGTHCEEYWLGRTVLTFD